MGHPYSFLFENNQTITKSKRTARQFALRYRKSGKKINDGESGIKHIYRTVKNEDGTTKIKRIKVELPKTEDK